MANQTPLTQWLADHRQSLDLKIKEFGWPKHWSSQVYDFQVEISVDDRISVGRGSSGNEVLALEKACAEAIERLVCNYLKISTKGVAVHSEIVYATENSRLEAQEWALFDWHVENNVGFRRLSENAVGAAKIPPWTHNLSADVQFFEMGSIPDLHSSVCLIREGEQAFLGSSVSAHADSATEKSLIEAARNLLAWRANPAEFNQRIAKDHNLWTADRSAINKFSVLFDVKPDSPQPSPFLLVKTETIGTQPISILHGCPVAVARSTAFRATL